MHNRITQIATEHNLTPLLHNNQTYYLADSKTNKKFKVGPSLTLIPLTDKQYSKDIADIITTTQKGLIT